MISLVPETMMVDVGKLISLGYLLVRKVTWLVLTTTSTTLILSRAFGADRMTRIAYIYSRFPITHSLSHFHFLTLWLTETAHTLLHFDFQRQHSLSPLSNTIQMHITWVCVHSANFFFLVLPFRLDLFQPRTQPQKFLQTLKETNNQHGRRHVAIFLYIDTLNT